MNKDNNNKIYNKIGSRKVLKQSLKKKFKIIGIFGFPHLKKCL